MKINIGDIYWIHNQEGISHPQVIIKIDNNTITVSGLTTNRNKANMPGNVILEPGEGNLESQSIVEVSKVSTIEETQFKEYIGTLSAERVNAILKGIRFLENTYFSS